MMSKVVEVAEQLARKYHAGQLYDGKDYVDTHVAEVVRRVSADPSATDVHVAAAWLHDVLEDTEAQVFDLAGPIHDAAGDLNIMSAVIDLTRYEGETYHGYMIMLLDNPDAILVKYHDSAANYAYGQRPKYKKNMELLLPFLPEASQEHVKNSS